MHDCEKRWMILRMKMDGKCESSNKNSLVIRKESKCHGMNCTNKKLLNKPFTAYAGGSIS